MRQKRSGFTLIELLVVLAITALLLIVLFLSLRSSRQRAKDARTKDYLHDLKTAFEEYYNDNYCYPPSEWFDSADDCETTQFSPYIAKIKCDHTTDLPYHVEYDDTGCEWFQIYTNLYFEDEDLCAKYDCEFGDYNYGVSSGNIGLDLNCGETPSPSPSSVPSPSPSPTPSPTPSPSPSPSSDPEAKYYCQSINNCTEFQTMFWSCNPSFRDPNCSGVCAHSTGSCTWIYN